MCGQEVVAVSLVHNASLVRTACCRPLKGVWKQALDVTHAGGTGFNLTCWHCNCSQVTRHSLLRQPHVFGQTVLACWQLLCTIPLARYSVDPFLHPFEGVCRHGLCVQA